METLSRFFRRENYKNSIIVGGILGSPMILFVIYIALINIGIFSMYVFNEKYDHISGVCDGNWYCDSHKGFCSSESYGRYFGYCFMLGLSASLNYSLILLIAIIICYCTYVALSVFIDYLKKEWKKSRREIVRPRNTELV